MEQQKVLNIPYGHKVHTFSYILKDQYVFRIENELVIFKFKDITNLKIQGNEDRIGYSQYFHSININEKTCNIYTLDSDGKLFCEYSFDFSEVEKIKK